MSTLRMLVALYHLWAARRTVAHDATTSRRALVAAAHHVTSAMGLRR